MIDYRRISWWYWLATAVLLTAGVFGNERAFPSVIALSSWQMLHFFIEDGSLGSSRVQVRLGYTLMMAVAFWEPLRALYVLPLIGTWAQVLFGYCALARALTLAPWNRHRPLTADLLLRTFLARPVRGKFTPRALSVTAEIRLTTTGA